MEIKAKGILRARKCNNHLSEKMGAEAGDTESKMEEKKKENNCWNEGKLM